jgi:hypothetical protein
MCLVPRVRDVAVLVEPTHRAPVVPLPGSYSNAIVEHRQIQEGENHFVDLGFIMLHLDLPQLAASRANIMPAEQVAKLPITRLFQALFPALALKLLRLERDAWYEVENRS